MPKITFVNADGTRRTVVARDGQSVMSAAVENGIEAIVAECGGACACGTCHCFIDEGWADRLAAPQSLEQEMIECLLNPAVSSRLSCQIRMCDELDGLVVHLPEAQY